MRRGLRGARCCLWAWRFWQIGGYRCGNITRQAFDAARGEGHWLDLCWGGFPGADAPSVGTEKTVYKQCRVRF